MRRYNIATSSVVNLARLKGQAAYLAMPSGGVRHYKSCSEDELIAAGYLAYTEDAVPEHYAPGVYEDVETPDKIHRTYPNPILQAAPWRQQLTNAIQVKKVTKRDGGFLVDGVLFDSDAGANIAYLNFGVLLQQAPSTVQRWKTSGNTWVDMDAALFTKVSAGFATNLRAAFAWQDSMTQALAVAPDTYAALKAIEDAINAG